MTLKTLDKLRYLIDNYWESDSSDPFEYAEILADVIQAEVNKYYLPRPLFEDGEPVQFGDAVHLDDTIFDSIDTISYGVEGDVCIWCGDDIHSVAPGELLERYVVDTQERIDADATLSAMEYAEKHQIPPFSDDLEGDVRLHLLSRQRKLIEKKVD